MVGMNNEKNRKAWIEKTLNNINPGLKIIDVGAGELANKIYCKHLEYVSQDFCQYDGKGDNVALQTGEWNTSKIDIVSDITNIPVEDASFDVVLCTEVLEHVPDPVKAIEEMVRICKKNGEIILTAPFCSLTHFSPYHYYSGFNKYFYIFHLERLGCKILEIEQNGNFFEYLAQELLRLQQITEKYAQSKLRYLEKISIRILLKALGKFSKKDNESADLLCFGYHIRGRKL